MAKQKVVSRRFSANVHVRTLAGAYIHVHSLVHTHVHSNGFCIFTANFSANVHVRTLAGAYIHVHSLVHTHVHSNGFCIFTGGECPKSLPSTVRRYLSKKTNTQRNTRSHKRTHAHRKCKKWHMRKTSQLCQEVVHCATAGSHN